MAKESVGSTIQRELFSLRDIAEATGLSEGKVRNEVKAGRIRTLRAGKRHVVSRDGLMQWIRLLESESRA